ncbi:TonB-dependent receptor SusC [Kordia antarctica]|uniref:TonB-dependent receptor SusC n=1 Tax=Kordia antarctica TaxID=1218801 RepID=A0A7L4ZP84_9FLAO|nr:carboxypeptidase-like regulatory domain-containing protein [Kordia antarctica]QHI38249.1 TonB-dependent receptor SusC [Kordia antarctica]
MKTQVTFTRKLWIATILMVVAFTFNPMYGQSDTKTTAEAQSGRTIKGIVSNESGPLDGVNITLKDSNSGTVTNAKGEFTFPKPLKTGDVLLISYLGYQTAAVKIKANTSFIRTALTEEILEFMGSLNSNKRYKSKRTN